MGLGHRRFCAIHNIADQLPTVRQIVLTAIEITNSFLIHQKEVIRSGASCNINIFPQFDITLRTQDRQATIAPYVPAPAACTNPPEYIPFRCRSAKACRQNLPVPEIAGD